MRTESAASEPTLPRECPPPHTPTTPSCPLAPPTLPHPRPIPLPPVSTSLSHFPLSLPSLTSCLLPHAFSHEFPPLFCFPPFSGCCRMLADLERTVSGQLSALPGAAAAHFVFVEMELKCHKNQISIANTHWQSPLLTCGVVWCVVVWCGVAWCGVVWCVVAWRGVAWRGVVWCGVLWCGVVWCGVAWRGVAWCGVVWCGVVWCGVAWRGVAWCGVLWRGAELLPLVPDTRCGVVLLFFFPFVLQNYYPIVPDAKDRNAKARAEGTNPGALGEDGFFREEVPARKVRDPFGPETHVAAIFDSLRN